MQLVIKATDGRILKKTRKIEFRLPKKDSASEVRTDGQRFKFDEESGKIKVYDASKVRIEEVLPLLIKSNRARKHF